MGAVTVLGCACRPHITPTPLAPLAGENPNPKPTDLPKDVVPYALRHSSIVRQLRAGLPVRLVAALHDTSSAIIERHYAAAIVDALDDVAAGAVIPLVSDERESKVVRPTRWAGTT